jgi:hypothetical protein
MQTLSETLQDVRLGEARAHANLTLFPLLAQSHTPAYLTLDQALAGGELRIEEVSQAGSVPTLRVVNQAEHAVLLLDGEELVGAKQNRVLNLTILVPARAVLDIPVSCVEQGRWAYRGSAFETSGAAQHASGRARKTRSVSESLRSAGIAHSDQGEVWRDIADKAERMGVHSPTHAMADLYCEHREGVEAYMQALQPLADQCGALFAIDGVVVGMDLFDSAATLAALLPKLARSYALDAVETAAADAPAVPRDLAEAFLADVEKADVERFPAVGLGEDLRILAPRVAGGALLLDSQLVHLCAFRLADPVDQPTRASANLIAASRRGRFHRRG